MMPSALDDVSFMFALSVAIKANLIDAAKNGWSSSEPSRTGFLQLSSDSAGIRKSELAWISADFFDRRMAISTVVATLRVATRVSHVGALAPVALA
ncbi:hypothetical protein PAPYR_2890 [Paratrimastix pyriformis]|uniref:Uncharacterized protein n=1 Tax=Paratrimastix pyriformis TaxID=342808 RepID=A0ABQ8UQB2_9EUKA|nr:hypothetical protein PAPYR_2890 [Paratrimastix pyriformis]